MIKILAIDPSFSRTGFAYNDDSGETVHVGHLGAYSMNVQAAVDIASAVATKARWIDADLVVIESPIVRGKTSPAVQMGMAGLGWIIRAHIYCDYHWIDVSPTDRMLWATGKGQANKDQVLAGARKIGLVCGDKDYDEADAYVLHDIATTAYELAPYETIEHLLHVSRRCVLGRCNWPRIDSIKPDYPAVEMPKTAKGKREASERWEQPYHQMMDLASNTMVTIKDGPPVRVS